MLPVRKLWVEKPTVEKEQAFLKDLKNELTSCGTFDPSIFSPREQEQGPNLQKEIPATPQQGRQEPKLHPRSLLERAAKTFKTIREFQKRAAKPHSNFVPLRKSTRPLSLKLVAKKRSSTEKPSIINQGKLLIKKIEKVVCSLEVLPSGMTVLTSAQNLYKIIKKHEES